MSKTAMAGRQTRPLLEGMYTFNTPMDDALRFRYPTMSEYMYWKRHMSIVFWDARL